MLWLHYSSYHWWKLEHLFGSSILKRPLWDKSMKESGLHAVEQTFASIQRCSFINLRSWELQQRWETRMMTRHYTAASQEAGMVMLTSLHSGAVQEVGSEVAGAGQEGAEARGEFKIRGWVQEGIRNWAQFKLIVDLIVWHSHVWFICFWYKLCDWSVTLTLIFNPLENGLWTRSETGRDSINVQVKSNL